MPPPPISDRQRIGACCLRLFLVLIPFGIHAGSGLQLWAAEPAACCKNCPACQHATAEATRTSGAWLLRDTNNFCICCPCGMDPAAIGQSCESLRDELTRKWLGDAAAKQSWPARCYVVVHPSTASYLREVGAAGSKTLGSSLTRTDQGHIVSRRIDIRCDVDEPLRAALPHEMTHVILADAFAGEEMPRWADEGMAMLADPPEKLAGHNRDLDAAIAAQRIFHVAELLMKNEYPTADGRAVFYGESASLVRYLISRRPAADFVGFVHLAAKAGYDASLREVYGIHDVVQLEHLWRSQVLLAMR